jgi:hypothetical protein
MGHDSNRERASTRAALAAIVIALSCLALAQSAQAAPVHPRQEALDVTGLNHACGAAVDSKGDFYASSAGESKIKVYDPSHVLLTEIADANTPCGLAVTTTGALYVSEKATGEVVRFKPNKYPFEGTPTYGPREVIDASTKAKGIAVDPIDNRLYVAEATKVAIYKADGSFEANVGEGTLTEASGVAAYAYEVSGPLTERYLWVADAQGLAADRLHLFRGQNPKTLKPSRQLTGSTAPDGSFGFGSAGAYLAADPGNRSGEKCVAVGEQACSAGHLFLYDAAHKALDEFDATGEYLDRTANAAFADAEPTAVAIERSGTANDGTIYVTAGAGAGAKALAFGPLKAPFRETLKEPKDVPAGLSQTLKGARAVATDSHGNLYAGADTAIHVYDSKGTELLTAGKPLIEDAHKPWDIAVDSTCNVYVLDENGGLSKEAEVTYYTPSSCPPKAGTTYSRQASPIVIPGEFPEGSNLLKAIAIDPGPGPGKGHLFVTSNSVTHEYGFVENEFEEKELKLLKKEFGKCVGGIRQSIAVNGANGIVYIGTNPKSIYAVDETGEVCLARFENTGSASGKAGSNPLVAVDQSNGHVLTFDGATKGAREYDAAGSFVAEFGNFTEGLTLFYRIAVDNSCAIHEPPLDETTTPTCKEYDPANGTAYVAFDDTSASHPPYDVTAFGPLVYVTPGGPPVAVTGVADEFGPGSATLHGTVDPEETLLEECKFEYLTKDEYEANGETFSGAESEECAESPEEIGEGSKPVAVHADVESLEPETAYRFRLVASNSGGASKGDAVLFGPPVPIAKKPLPVLYHEATLRGEIETSGLATKYHFDYGTEESYGQSTLVVELPPGEESVAVNAPLTGLEEGTEYHFRLVAENPVGTAEDEGPPFETLERRESPPCPNAEYRFGLSANLPDCRAYELVTPAQTNGLSPYAAAHGTSPSLGFSNWLTVQRDEGAGERLTYFADGTLPGFEGNGVLDGYRAERGAEEHPAGGWQSALFSPDYAETVPGAHASPFQLGVASDQLYSAWEINHEPSTFPKTRAHGVYLRTPTGFEALAQGSVEVEGKTEVRTDLGALSRYVSAGGAHVIFSSKAHLEDDAPPEGNVALYDRAAGSASAHVLTLPPSNASEDEEAEFLDALLSKEQASFSGVSEDGATVVFKVGVGLYARLDNANTERITPRTAQVGDTLGCAAGPLLGLAPGEKRKFQWLRDGAPISGASGGDLTSSTDYTTVPADEGAALQCQTVATEDDPRSVAVSAPIEIDPLGAGQAPQPPAQIAAPTPPSPTVGTVESCNAGSWEGAESLAYQWYVNGKAIAGATSQTYEVQAADVPGTLQCVVTGTNAAAAVAKASGLQPTSPAPAKATPVATAQAAVKTTYAGTSEDGRYVFFALGDGVSPRRLFRFDTQSESATEIAATGIFAEVSPDGSHAFFSSTEALSGGEENDNGEEAEEGARNLYAWDGTETSFIGRLSAEDFKQNAFAGISGMNLAAWTAAIGLSPQAGRSLAPIRSTPGGGAFAFQSHARLTAYDNEGVGEIYRYEPAAAAGERLLCVSCDPSGAPPSADALLEDIRFGVSSPVKSSTMIANLTDGGKEVVFQSFDRLLPEDANEVEDVYEWEAQGAGEPECTRPGGCLALISSGQGETPSFLYGMSADGHDVFFRTQEKLVGLDVPGSPSIYDARVGGGIPEPAEPAPCQGDACQGSGSTPPTLPSPATTGAGEGKEAKAQPCRKGKHRVRGRCVKRHSKKHHRRAKHNRRTHR